MFDQIFQRLHAIKRHINGPLLEERLKYLRHWAEQGASKKTLQRIAQNLLIIIERLDLENKNFVTIQEVENAADSWSRRQPRHPRMQCHFSQVSKARFILDTTNLLRLVGRLQCPSTEASLFSYQISQFANYIRQERGLSEETINHRCWQVKDFLNRACNKDYSLQVLSMTKIDQVLAQKGSIDGYSRRTIQTYVSSIRSFLRYAEIHGWCQRGLAEAIKAPRVFQEETLPSSPSWKDVQDLLKGSEGDRLTDIRDRAILMLLAVYGLRSGEIAKLCLEDLDWRKDIIYIKRTKGKKAHQFPFSQTVGKAILRYLKEVRPKNCFYREIFLTMRAPYVPLKRVSLFQIVNRRWKPLKVPIQHHGPHSLRHACATRLINEGISLKEISDYLGHQDLETTRIYAKVNLTGLRKVANFDIGGVL